MYVRGYLQGSENGRVVTIVGTIAPNLDPGWSYLLLAVQARTHNNTPLVLKRTIGPRTSLDRHYSHI